MDEHPRLSIKRLTLPSTASEGVVIWLAGPAGTAAVPEPLWNRLSLDERNRANRFFHDRDRNLFAMTRAVLRSLLSEAASVPANQILFTEGPHGKPSLLGTKGPQFNVSHSGSWALIGLSDFRPIGVDIELTRNSGDELDLARSFFSDAEYRALERLEEGSRLQSFYKIWTCKEAVLKALGAGISAHLKDFSVKWTDDQYAIIPECSLPLPASIAAYPVDVPMGYTGCYALA